MSMSRPSELAKLHTCEPAPCERVYLYLDTDRVNIVRTAIEMLNGGPL